MANTAVSSLTLQITTNSALTTLQASASYTMSGEDAALLTQTATTSWVAIALGSASNIGKLLVKVLAGSGSQTVQLATANDGSGIFSTIPEGEGVLLVKPPSTIYCRSNTGTVQIQFGLCEQ